MILTCMVHLSTILKEVIQLHLIQTKVYMLMMNHHLGMKLNGKTSPDKRIIGMLFLFGLGFSCNQVDKQNRGD